MDKNCKAFNMGFCPHEEFYVEAVTEKCPYPHVSAAREAYTHQGLPFEYEVLATYKSIIEDVDKKAAVNSSIVQEDMTGEQHYRALTKCQQLIEAKSTELDDFDKLHSLLIIHGRLVQDVIDSRSKVQYSVCANCGSLKDSRECAHKFCEKYRKLRDMVGELEKSLPKRECSSPKHIY